MGMSSDYLNAIKMVLLLLELVQIYLEKEIKEFLFLYFYLLILLILKNLFLIIPIHPAVGL